MMTATLSRQVSAPMMSKRSRRNPFGDDTPGEGGWLYAWAWITLRARTLKWSRVAPDLGFSLVGAGVEPATTSL
jgi:hypothetical protein